MCTCADLGITGVAPHQSKFMILVSNLCMLFIGFKHALRIVKPQGTIILKSTFAGSPPIDLTKVVVGEVKVIGSRCGPFPPAMRLLKNDSVSVADLIDATFPLSQGLEAFTRASLPGVRKVLLKP